jgi:hypothetical protein
MHPRAWAFIVAAAAACAALAASAQPQRPQAPARFVRAPLREARALAVDMQGARGQARTPISQRGKQINLRFITENRALIDKVSIPVLLPSEPLLAEHLQIFPNGAHYAVSSRSGGMAFHMTGHGRAFDLMPAAVQRLPRADLRARIPSDGIVIEHTEFGLDAGFNRFGAAYSISLECADPADVRCTDDRFVRGLIARLMVVIPGEPG